MLILGIETTCDETGIGIVENGTMMLSNIVSSSSQLHNKYGGIVPEVAAREQVKVIVPALEESLYQSNLKLCDIDAISVAYGPGLVGSVLVGVETAKTLALVLEKPLIAVNHLLGHLYANWINTVDSKIVFPLIALIVSGGHTDLVLMKNFGNFKLLGSTKDDAAGEVFDKVARVLGLGYPGGPEIEKLASQSGKSKSKVRFPRPMINDKNFDFSFSGLKTSVLNLVDSDQYPETSKEEIAREFQNAVIEVLVKKTFAAAEKFFAKTIIVGGGVSSNSQLKNRMLDEGKKIKINVSFPGKGLSVDNGAMIAAAAFFEKKFVNPLELQANPSLHF